ncbi:MAG: hypothetical protein RRB13_09890 [bacterium]|nr:hypothetical protein [bacterium]
MLRWLTFLMIFSLGLPGWLAAADNEKKASEVVQSALPDQETAQTGLLVLQFAATGMTDSAARAYSSMIAQNVANTNRFLVTDHEQAEQVMVKEAPRLLPCFEIGCGIQMAKILGSERVLTGNLVMTPSGFVSLKVKLVNVLDNSIELEDMLRFNDETMDRRLYAMAQRIARNTPLKGKIIKANNKLAVIDLGSNDGISVGDRLVIYKNLSGRADQMNPMASPDARRANMGILTVTKVGDESSEGTYFQKIETPEMGQYVTTYLEKRKQIQLVDHVRKELDTSLRHVFEIEKKVVIRPVSLEDIDKNKWIATVRMVEADRDYWQMWLAGTGAASGFVLSQFKEGDDLKVVAALAGLAFSSVRYFETKSVLRQLVQEGKFKGYLEPTFNPNIPQGALGIQYRVTF